LSSPLHPELLGLLGGCRHSPADDTPRLILADWLEEHADSSGLPAADALARAELIRVQVELARPTLDTARTVQLRAAEARLLAAHSPDWLGDLPRLFDEARPAGDQTYQPPHVAQWKPWHFARGLLRVELRREELENAKLCAWFGTRAGAWTETATVGASGFAELEQLEVPDPLSAALGVTAHLGAGREAQPEALTGARAKRVLTSAAFGRVRELHLSNDALGTAALKLLAGANVSGVQRLFLAGGVGAACAARLAAVPFERLTVLRAGRCEMGAPEFAALVRSPHFARLVVLDAYRNHFGNAGAVALAESPLAESLRHVEFQNCNIGDRGGVALARSPLFARLYGPQLNLMMNPLGNGFAKALAAAANAAYFTELVFRECSIGDAGAKALAESSHLANVTYLDMWSNRVGDAGAKALADSDALPNVRDLNLRDNRVTATGAAALRAKYGDRAKV
jgi:uncharacterized protein (TIGR02996 family)